LSCHVIVQESEYMSLKEQYLVTVLAIYCKYRNREGIFYKENTQGIA